MGRRLSTPRSTWLLAFPLALWSALPGVQWCGIGWAEVRLDCMAACSIAAPTCPPDRCAAESDGSGSCEPRPGRAAYPGGRAYCLEGPAGGEGVAPIPPAAPDDAPPAAIVPAGIARVAIAPAAERSTAPTVGHPPTPAIGAVARSRAPPAGTRNTG